MDDALQQDLGSGRCIQPGGLAAPHPAARAAQQAGELVLGQGIGHRRHRRQHRRRIGADGHQHRKWPVRPGLLPGGIVLGPATVRQPAHDHPVAADHLLAIDGQVLPSLVHAAGDDQAEGDQAPGVLRPAVLDRQAPQVDLVAFVHLFAERGVIDLARCHVRQLRQFRPTVQCLAQRGRPARLFQRSQQLAQFVQRGQRAVADGQLDPATVAEQVAQHRMRRADRLVHQQRRPALAQRAQAQRGAFQHRIDRRIDLQQLPVPGQVLEEASQVMHVRRRDGRWPCTLAAPAPPGDDPGQAASCRALPGLPGKACAARPQ